VVKKKEGVAASGRAPPADYSKNGNKKPPGGGFLFRQVATRAGATSFGSALASLETRVRLADHEDLATAANDLAVTVTGLGRLQGRQDFHCIPRRKRWIRLERGRDMQMTIGR
jgi:hypothetical protein